MLVPQRRRAPARYEVGFSVRKYPAILKETYRKHYLEYLDLIIAFIRTRFNQPGYKISNIYSSSLPAMTTRMSLN